MAVSLKTQNMAVLTPYLAWCLSLYIIFLSGDKNLWQNVASYFENFTAKDGMVAGLSPAIVLVLNGILSVNIKAIIIFWKIKNPLPGSMAFTKLGPSDERINMNRVKQIIGTIPTDMNEQNSLWYKYYKKYQDIPMIKAAHKHFLLTRDMASITLLMLVMLPCSIIIVNNNWKGAFIYSGILVCQYIFLAISAQNYGKRFVCNVLAEMCATD